MVNSSEETLVIVSLIGVISGEILKFCVVVEKDEKSCWSQRLFALL